MIAILTRVLLLLLATLGGACAGEGASSEPTTPDKLQQEEPASDKAAQEKAPAQSYTEAWQLICAAERLAEVDASASRQQRGAQVARWIVEHVTNKQARYWFISYGQVTEDKEAVFRAEATRAGFPQCPLTSLLFSPPEPAAPADES